MVNPRLALTSAIRFADHAAIPIALQYLAAHLPPGLRVIEPIHALHDARSPTQLNRRSFFRRTPLFRRGTAFSLTGGFFGRARLFQQPPAFSV
jgi:hypothetical protein